MADDSMSPLETLRRTTTDGEWTFCAKGSGGSPRR
jgi:hypothetical protein